MDKYTYSIGVVIMVKTKLIKNRKGVSLVYVMLVLIVMSILSVAIFTLYVSNLNQVKIQEDSVKAHFVAMSGVEIAFGALVQDNQSLLNYHFNKPIGTTVSSISDTVVVTGGEADISISSYVDDGFRYVRITSLGRIDNSSLTKQLSMHFRIEYPEIQVWE